jgi:sugar phosphate isomerase/epimerase
MSYKYSLAYLTVIGCPPPEMTYVAARAGYDYVSLRLIPMGVAGEAVFLPEDKAMIRKTKAALRETGLSVLDLELARILEDIDPRDYVPAMEVAAELGAQHVISSAWTAGYDDREYIVECYGEICDLAAQFGLTVSLEFPTFSSLTNLVAAADVVRSAGRANSGILLDTLYVHFSQLNLAELDSLPRKWFHFMHICDTGSQVPGSMEEMKHIARDKRLYLGEGCIDFGALLKKLPVSVFSVELPHTRRVKEYGYDEHARRCLASAKGLFGQIQS